MLVTGCVDWMWGASEFNYQRGRPTHTQSGWMGPSRMPGWPSDGLRRGLFCLKQMLQRLDQCLDSKRRQKQSVGLVRE